MKLQKFSLLLFLLLLNFEQSTLYGHSAVLFSFLLLFCALFSHNVSIHILYPDFFVEWNKSGAKKRLMKQKGKKSPHSAYDYTKMQGRDGKVSTFLLAPVCVCVHARTHVHVTETDIIQKSQGR